MMSESRISIAVLDDDAAVRRALVRLFQDTQYHAVTYDSAESLFAELASLAPKCLVADFQLPRMDAVDVLNHLHRAGCQIPTVIITAFDEPETRRRCIAAGASAYLTKPVRRATLLETIDRLVG